MVTSAATDAGPGELSELHREVLEFERTWWKYPAAKESRIRDAFDFGATRYYQILNWVIDQPGAMAYDPMTTKRLLRLREARLAQRRA